MIRTPNTARPLFAIAAVLFAAPLVAQAPLTVTGQPVLQERVTFADLDLSKASHRNRLKSRVYSAAERVCIQAEGPIEAPAASFSGAPDCTELTFANAKPQIVAAFRRAKLGERPSATALTIGVRAIAR